MLDLIPSDTTNYMVGLSVGPKSGVSYEKTGHLTGTHGTIRYREDCVYTSKVYSGPQIYLTEDGNPIKSCKYDWSNLDQYTMFPLAVRPIVGPGDEVTTVNEPYSTGSNVFAQEAKFFDEWKKFAVGVNMRDINFDTTEPGVIATVQLGRVMEQCDSNSCYKKFNPVAAIKLQVRGKKAISHVERFEECGDECAKSKQRFNAILAGDFFKHA